MVVVTAYRESTKCQDPHQQHHTHYLSQVTATSRGTCIIFMSRNGKLRHRVTQL